MKNGKCEDCQYCYDIVAGRVTDGVFSEDNQRGTKAIYCRCRKAKHQAKYITFSTSFCPDFKPLPKFIKLLRDKK